VLALLPSSATRNIKAKIIFQRKNYMIFVETIEVTKKKKVSRIYLYIVSQE
jgi:hypothetical protein